jgi:ABC-type antimicrobial peptide transport system permease subunit
MPANGFVVVTPLQEVVDDQSRSWRLGAALFTAFGGLALLVAVVGLYGTVSYSVAQRRQEVGVRIALGARRGNIVGLVVGRAIRPVAIAVLVGLAISWTVAPKLQPLLYAQSATDPQTYLVVAAAMLLAAFVAGLIPAARAARLDPCTALRAD